MKLIYTNMGQQARIASYLALEKQGSYSNNTEI